MPQSEENQEKNEGQEKEITFDFKKIWNSKLSIPVSWLVGSTIALTTFIATPVWWAFHKMEEFESKYKEVVDQNLEIRKTCECDSTRLLTIENCVKLHKSYQEFYETLKDNQ